eukprot:CAMPEP_0175814942 /NCGR_PEP_ID=MMETSP0107_2-20121207/5690_1 /TAXON_ID=195067 ORGANISM="Goniomonas pacifica, Strain CCMP1869" /NCGR_SAMPLE_ID=MMETSP0107_2 /ASSEMBLY_ACC=CAM_ASM_000203 /LENGTH=74 /DNA_ID=CAMNT_0017126927 /DNA_START=91 /DNA_END=312 /DNA_ORIENTATION=-
MQSTTSPAASGLCCVDVLATLGTLRDGQGADGAQHGVTTGQQSHGGTTIFTEETCLYGGSRTRPCRLRLSNRSI